MGERPKSHPHKNWDCEMTVTGEIKRKWGREEGEVLESHLRNRITGSESVAVFKDWNNLKMMEVLHSLKTARLLSSLLEDVRSSPVYPIKKWGWRGLPGGGNCAWEGQEERLGRASGGSKGVQARGAREEVFVRTCCLVIVVQMGWR
ncbi:unnamed protein product [Pleuronectes platessa]|uniref:Uncharacterized protein n=1 Tax=Pleuronectes platessa TaxID=8262 RepID=A0A9N7V130_PLEPL|nr:unnamed protein product [Pleuronectes platessa]